MRSRRKLKIILGQTQMNQEEPKIYGHSESSHKRDIYSITDLPLEPRKTSSKQSKLRHKTTGKRTTKQDQNK